MGKTVTCSFERCTRPAWHPDETGRPYCIFHSPDIEGKRAEFDKAWAEFLKSARDSEGKLFNLSCAGFIFPININFSGERFSGHTYFNFATFSGHTYFNGAAFTGHIYFTSAVFSGKTYFTNATFPGKVYFDSASFAGETSFKNADFLWDVSFGSTLFKDEVSFGDARFSGEASFDSTSFSQNTDFERAVFLKKAYFYKTVFRQEGFFTAARFVGVDLSYSSFASCSFKDVRKGTHYNLKPITWEIPPARWQFWKWRTSREPVPPTNFSNIDTRGIFAASNRQFVRDMADQQFIMQMRERHKFWYYVWLITCDCGRSFWRFLFWCFVVAGFFGMAYAIAGERWFENTGEWNFLTPFYYSFVTFLRLGLGDIAPKLGSGWGQFAVMFEVFIGYIGLGGLISIFSNILARRS